MQVFLEEVHKLMKKAVKEQFSVEIPPVSEFGDFAVPCFRLTKENPAKRAVEIASLIKPTKFIDKIESKGPYVNFYVNKEALAKEVLTNVKEKGKDYGRGNKKEEKVMVEYSQPNTHKGFHVGHLRNVSLGDSLVKIMRFDGYPVIAANYINDTGSHVSKCIWAYLKFFKGKEPFEKKGEWLGNVYVEATKRLLENPDLKTEVQTIHQRIEAEDPALIEVWEMTKEWSMDDFLAIYKELNVHFDSWFFDNELISAGKDVVNELVEKRVAVVDQGATIVDLKKYGLDVALILKSDGSALYITKDFALAKQKFEQHKIDRSIYVVGAEQSMHFKQLFKILELYGFPQAKKCRHLSYELVMLAEGKMSSRDGTVVLYSEFSKQVHDYSCAEVERRHPEWTEIEKAKASHEIAVAAMKFGMLYQDNNKTIIFDPQKSCEFDGETGPYCQYAYARMCSILKKSPERVPETVDFTIYSDEREFELIKLIGKFPLVVDNATHSCSPSTMCRYVLDLSQAFNDFYESCPIIKAEDKVRHARLFLLDATRVVLSSALELLGISAIDQM